MTPFESLRNKSIDYILGTLLPSFILPKIKIDYELNPTFSSPALIYSKIFFLSREIMNASGSIKNYSFSSLHLKYGIEMKAPNLPINSLSLFLLASTSISKLFFPSTSCISYSFSSPPSPLKILSKTYFLPILSLIRSISSGLTIFDSAKPISLLGMT